MSRRSARLSSQLPIIFSMIPLYHPWSPDRYDDQQLSMGNHVFFVQKSSGLDRLVRIVRRFLVLKSNIEWVR